MTALDLRYGYVSARSTRLPVAHATPDAGSAPSRAYGTRALQDLEIVWDNATFWDWRRMREHYDANKAAFLASLPGYAAPVLVQHRQGPTGTPSGPNRLTVTVFLMEALATSEAT